MDTRNKLKEVQYFLEALVQTQNSPEQFYYNLSAFLSAWRSVLDVMLYDFVEHYRIGLTREDRMSPNDFELAARILNKKDALRFIRWWRQKLGVLSLNPLWNMRHVIVHRGYPEITYRIYAPDTLSSGSIVISSGEVISLSNGAFPTMTPVSGRTFEARFPEVLEKCKDAFSQMENIVHEAEKEFSIQL